MLQSSLPAGTVLRCLDCHLRAGEIRARWLGPASATGRGRRRLPDRFADGRCVRHPWLLRMQSDTQGRPRIPGALPRLAQMHDGAALDSASTGVLPSECVGVVKNCHSSAPGSGRATAPPAPGHAGAGWRRRRMAVELAPVRSVEREQALFCNRLAKRLATCAAVRTAATTPTACLRRAAASAHAALPPVNQRRTR